MGRIELPANLTRVVRTVAKLTPSVLVGVSGKDSLAAVDLCCAHFEHVEGFFLYTVPSLSFQETWLNTVGKRFGIVIHRAPHFGLGELFKYAVYRPPSPTANVAQPTDVNACHNALREKTGIGWIALGERRSDSIQRSAMLSENQGISLKRLAFWPLYNWSSPSVWTWLKLRNLPVPRDSAELGWSFGGLRGQELAWVKENHPDDYAKILEWFPHAEVAVRRYECQEAQR